MLRDTFAEELSALFAQGWVMTSYSRYDPTTMAGLTPSGKAFTLSAVRQGAGALVTVTVAGNTRTTTLANWDADFEPAAKSVAAIAATWQKLPVNQR